MQDYDDEYGTCVYTYATLRVASTAVEANEISRVIGCAPTDSFRMGDVRTNWPGVKDRNHRFHGWFYSTKELSNSRDCRRHIDLLLEGPLANHEALRLLREGGCETSVAVMYCYTQGGPTMSPRQMRGLADAGVDIWWDLYHEPESRLDD